EGARAGVPPRGKLEDPVEVGIEVSLVQVLREREAARARPEDEAARQRPGDGQVRARAAVLLGGREAGPAQAAVHAPARLRLPAEREARLRDLDRAVGERGRGVQSARGEGETGADAVAGRRGDP